MAKKPTKTKAKKNKNAKPRGGLRAARRVLGALAVLIALTVLCTLSLTIWFPVKSSVWEGPSRYTDKQLTAVVEKSIGQRNIFRADLKALAAKLPAELPYVKSARVTRRLPGTLLVTMEECVPMLAQKQGEHWWLLDETGKLLEAVAELPPELLTLSGAELIKPAAGKQAKWEGAVLPPDFKDLLGVLKDHGFEERITGLQISASPLPDVIYQGRIRIKFGSGLPAGSSSLTVREVLGEKLRVGREALRQIEEENPHQRGVLDLSAYGKAYFTPDWTEQFSTFVN